MRQAGVKLLTLYAADRAFQLLKPMIWVLPVKPFVLRQVALVFALPLMSQTVCRYWHRN